MKVIKIDNKKDYQTIMKFHNIEICPDFNDDEYVKIIIMYNQLYNHCWKNSYIDDNCENCGNLYCDIKDNSFITGKKYIREYKLKRILNNENV